jgi:hypothetical protein
MTRSTGERIDVDALTPGTRILVQTRNSEYRLTLLPGGHRRVLIEGGVLPAVVEGSVEGAVEAGHLLHSGWIEVNQSLDMICGPQHLVTSPVRRISIERSGSPSTPRAT